MIVKSFLRLALLLGGGLAVLVLLPFVVPEAWLRHSLANWAEAQWQRPLQMERLRLRLLPAPSLRAEKIILGNAAAFGETDAPFLRVAQLRADFSWHQFLWQRTLAPQVLHLSAPQFFLQAPAKGAPNWQFAHKGGASRRAHRRASFWSAAAPRSLRVHMQDAMLSYQKEGAPQRRLRLDALSARFTRKADGLELLLHPLRLYGGELSLHAAMRPMGSPDSAWAGALSWERLAMESLFGDWGFPRVAGQMSGRMDFTSRGANATAFGEHLRAAGDVRVENGAFLGLDLSQIWKTPGLATVLALTHDAQSRFAIPQTAFRIEEGALHTAALQLHNADGPALLGEGQYRFADQQWRFVLRRPSSPDAIVLSGTPHKPKLSWQVDENLEHLRNRAAQTVLDQLVDELF